MHAVSWEVRKVSKARARKELIRWGGLAAVWIIAAIVGKLTGLDVCVTGAACCITMSANKRGLSADEIRLEDLPKVEERILAEAVAGEKVLYQFAKVQGWKLRHSGYDLNGEPMHSVDHPSGRTRGGASGVDTSGGSHART